MRKLSTFIILVSFALAGTGCAAIGKKWKSLISGGSTEEAAQKAKPTGLTYSQQNNSTLPVHRQYKRTTRQDFESRAQLEAKAGSLWVMEGQGAYLFSQNVVRMIGDPIGIRIEGDPMDQLSAKSNVINTLLKQIEDRRKRIAGRNLASEKGKEKTDAQGANTAPAPAPTPNIAQQPTPEQDKAAFAVKMVPTRVVERLVDGNYRVRGTQPFMIGSREYKVIVSGVVRAEDFNEQGISASQLLDSSFDIVSSKGAELRQ